MLMGYFERLASGTVFSKDRLLCPVVLADRSCPLPERIDPGALFDCTRDSLLKV
jgi:hypothetical protein